MIVALHDFVSQNGHVRFDDVHSEGKVLMSMLRGWQLLQAGSFVTHRGRPNTL